MPRRRRASQSGFERPPIRSTRNAYPNGGSGDRRRLRQRLLTSRSAFARSSPDGRQLGGGREILFRSLVGVCRSVLAGTCCGQSGGLGAFEQSPVVGDEEDE